MEDAGGATGKPVPKQSKNEWLEEMRKASSSKKDGKPAPTPIETPANGVKLPDRLLWIVQAFGALSRARLVNETGPQPITFADMAAYATLMFYNDEQTRSDLMYFITGMDIVYLKIVHAQIERAREREREKAKRESGRRRR